MAAEIITLNITPTGDMPVLHLAQYDTNRPFGIALKWGEDDYTLPEGITCELQMRKTDSKLVTITPTGSSENVLEFECIEQMCTCPGKNIAQLAFMDESDNIIHTLRFEIEVQRDVMQGGMSSASDIHNLETQIEEITQQVIGEDYYTKTEVDDLIDSIPTFDPTNYYDKSDVDGLLADKADVSDLPDMSNYYTKSETDTALSTKADAASTYNMTQVNNLLNLRLPKPQEQEVQNLPASVVTLANAGEDAPLTELTVAVTAVQAGSGTPSPSNPRAITGFSGANIVNTPDSDWAELWDIDNSFRGVVAFNQLVSDTKIRGTSTINGVTLTKNNDGSVTVNGTSNANTEAEITSFYDFLTNHIYYCRFCVSGGSSSTYRTYLFANNANTHIGTDYGNGTIVKGGTYTNQNLKPFIEIKNGITINNQTVYYQYIDLTAMFGSTIADYIYSLEQGTAGAGVAFFRNLYPDDYYPYNIGTNELVGGDNKVVTTIPFGQTVYGGVLDVTNGKLRVTHGEIDSYNGETINEPWISSIDEYVPNTNPSTGAQVVYELATPTEITLTEKEIDTLLHDNNIYSDTGDILSMKYIIAGSEDVFKYIRMIKG